MRKPTTTLFVVIALVVTLSLPAPAGSVPRSNHVIVVVLENQSYSEALAYMPWLKSVALKYSYTRFYYANTHPSIGNYFMMTTGRIITNNDGYTGTVAANNIVRQLIGSGKTWKAYAESLPYTGYIGGNKHPYVKRHVPMAYLTDVRNSSEKYNLVPFTRFATDLANGNLPHLSFVVPNNVNNAHDCPWGGSNCSTATKLKDADDWLRRHIAPVLSNREFLQDGILIITFDESKHSDQARGGGRILTVIAGPKVKRAYQDQHNYYQHQSLLRTVEYAFGLAKIGAAASTRSLGNVFVD